MHSLGRIERSLVKALLKSSIVGVLGFGIADELDVDALDDDCIPNTYV